MVPVEIHILMLLDLVVQPLFAIVAEEGLEVDAPFGIRASLALDVLHLGLELRLLLFGLLFPPDLLLVYHD